MYRRSIFDYFADTSARSQHEGKHLNVGTYASSTTPTSLYTVPTTRLAVVPIQQVVGISQFMHWSMWADTMLCAFEKKN